MLHRKLLEILSRLSDVEIKRLRLFLLSPYYSGEAGNKNILKLYDEIIKYNGSIDSGSRFVKS